MVLEYFGWPFLIVVSLVYGLCCIIGLLFAFFLGKYEKIEEKLDFSLLSAPVVTSLDIQIDIMDCWLKKYNKTVGITLSALSICIIVSLIKLF